MVDNKTTQDASAADARAQPGKKKTTVVEEGTDFNGQLKSVCALIVRGQLRGEVEAPSVTIAPGGVVTGSAKLGQLFSEGELTGQFDAESVRLAGRVGSGTSIRAQTIEARLGEDGIAPVVFVGDCLLEVGEEPREARREENGKAAHEPVAAAPAAPAAAPAPPEPEAGDGKSGKKKPKN